VLTQVKSAYYNVFDKGFFYLFIFIGGGGLKIPPFIFCLRISRFR